MKMGLRLRKLAGAIFLLIFVPIYALLAMLIAAAILPGQSGFVQFAYYLVAGIAWVIPAGAIIYISEWPFRPGKAAR